jgi:hypothetical protein
MSVPDLSNTPEHLKQTVGDEISPYVKVLFDNLIRSSRLLSQSQNLEGEAAQDLIRAAVVITHAFLEDFLRTLAVGILPTRDEATLNDIPLAGLNDNGRASKFWLGKLVQHKGKTVDDVIRESVSLQQEGVTFNSVGDISRHFKKLGLDPPPNSAEYYANIDKMIQRRHVIVHRGDKRSWNEAPQPISYDEVGIWIHATFSFLALLLGPVFFSQNSLEDLEKKFNIKFQRQ